MLVPEALQHHAARSCSCFSDDDLPAVSLPASPFDLPDASIVLVANGL